MFAERTRTVQMSPTFRVAAAARALRESGVDVLDFTLGEPDFATPAEVKEAGKAAIDRNVTKYTANEGTIELRRAIAAKLRDELGLDYGTDEIVCSPGAKASLFCAAIALFQEGDEVIIPSPYWATHPEQIRIAGATPVFVAARESHGFRLTAAEIEAAITPATKAVLLNYPSNPTGACWDASELAAIANVCVARNLLVIADEIYEKLLYGGRKFVSIATCPGMRERTVVTNGMSKAFAMTGWRLGWCAAPREIVAEISKMQSHSTGHPPSISQYAAVEAFHAAGGTIVKMAREFEARREIVMRRLALLPGVRCVPPDGAFYVFPNVSRLFGRTIGSRILRSGEDVALAFLDAAKVAVVPGEAFGSPNHVRISFACSREQIELGMDRIAKALA